MRKKAFFGVAAAGVATVFLATPAANAESTDHGTLAFRGEKFRPGQGLTLSGRCDAPVFRQATLDSDVLLPGLVSITNGGGPARFEGHQEVRKDAKPGKHTVSYMCGSRRVKATIVIVGDDKKPVPPKPTAPKPTGQVAVRPSGAADTGGEDVIVAVDNTAAAQQPTGPGAGMYALGGAALLVTGGAGVFAFRRLRKES